MNSQEDIDFVIREIAHYRKHDDIIRALCERSGYQWAEAASVVQRIEQEYHAQIQIRRRPFRTFLGIVMIASGLAVCAHSIYSLVAGELIPLTLALPLLDLELSNGGQLVELFIGFPLTLGGIATLGLAFQAGKKSASSA